MTKQHIVSYKNNGQWEKYYGKLPETVQAVELRTSMTLEELKEVYPEHYQEVLNKISKDK